MNADLLMLIDTDSLTRGENGAGSTSDTPAECVSGCAFMFTDLAHAIEGNGTADLHLRVNRGEVLRVWASSLSNQLDDEVFIYDIWGRDRLETVSAVVMVPQSKLVDHQPPSFDTKTVDFHYHLLAHRPARSELQVKFVVYGAPDGEGSRPVKGYFRWRPRISVPENDETGSLS